VNFDEYNEVINGEYTYRKIAKTLLDEGKCIIGWTDQEYDHRDILFTYSPKQLGGVLQRGLHWCRFYVSIIGHCSMGFLIEDDGRSNKKENSYIMEKLDLRENHCDIAICDLINGIIEAIDKIRKEEN